MHSCIFGELRLFSDIQAADVTRSVRRPAVFQDYLWPRFDPKAQILSVVAGECGDHPEIVLNMIVCGSLLFRECLAFDRPVFPVRFL